MAIFDANAYGDNLAPPHLGESGWPHIARMLNIKLNPPSPAAMKSSTRPYFSFQRYGHPYPVFVGHSELSC